MQFVCLDFETANYNSASACSVGIALFHDGRFTGAGERLLLPHRACRRFNPAYVAIHGITPAMVRNAPEFPELAQKLFRLLQRGRVIAHNAAFDIAVLRSLCEIYDIPCPDIEYFCTCKASRRFWKNLPDHKLHTLCGYIGHTFQHHQAGADAEACGRVYLAMMQEAHCTTLEEFDARVGIRPGRIISGTETPCRCLPLKKAKHA